MKLFSYLQLLCLTIPCHSSEDKNNNLRSNTFKSTKAGETVNVVIKALSNEGRYFVDTLLQKAQQYKVDNDGLHRERNLYEVHRKLDRFHLVSMKVPLSEMESLMRTSSIKVDVDRVVNAISDDESAPVSELSSASTKKETIPYGVDMVMENITFWNNLPNPKGSIRICVADTGYAYGHEDLPEAYVIGKDSPRNGKWASDSLGHGSHVAGIIAAIDNEHGIHGIIPNDKGGKFELVIAKALNDDGSGSMSSVLEAIEGCISQGAKVINLSLGGGGYSELFENEFRRISEEEGVLFIAAAGNSGKREYFYPASYPSVMAVAAIDEERETATFGTSNDSIEISAPGVKVLSTVPHNNLDTGSYHYKSGSSMAAPHVSGVAALLWMYFPDCASYQIREALKLSANDIKHIGCDTHSGHGIVQAQRGYELLSSGFCDVNKDTGYFDPENGCALACDDNSECNDNDPLTIDDCIENKCTYNCSSPITTVVINTDFFPRDTTWRITSITDHEDVAIEGPYQAIFQRYESFHCLQRGMYKFHIEDANGNGFGFFGSYSVSVGDDEVASGRRNFGSSQTAIFEV